jgi:hypothetical protein
MALAEIRHAAFGSAAAVVVRGVLPHTVRQALRSVGALAPERVDGAPIVPPLSGSAPS